MAEPTLPTRVRSARYVSRAPRTKAKATNASRSCWNRQAGPVNLDLEPIESWARSELERKSAAREQALRWSRELIRACANSIRAVHRREFIQADQLLTEATSLHRQICSLLAEMGDLYWT